MVQQIHKGIPAPKGRSLLFYANALVTAMLLLIWSSLAHADKKVSFFDNKGKKTCTFKVELAQTPGEHSKGLMFRKELAPHSGMLFIFPDEQTRHFWMKDTFIPLDIIFIGSRLVVVDLHRFARPRDETVIASRYPARYVLEVPAGQADRCSIKDGAKVRFADIPQ